MPDPHPTQRAVARPRPSLVLRQVLATARTILRIAAALPRQERLTAAVAGLTGAARDRTTFAYLARWPDDIRGSALDRPAQHYRMRIVSNLGDMLPLRNGDAASAYASSLATLRNRAAPARDRAVALAWLFHIVGDMHQPLHAGTWLSWQYPKTDRIGSIAYVRTSRGSAAVSLHEFWDDAADRPGSDLTGADALAAALARRFPRDRLPELARRPADFDVWTDESALLARRVAYQNGDLITGVTPRAAPILAPRYVETARSVSERRLAVAGQRLADILEATLRE